MRTPLPDNTSRRVISSYENNGLLYGTLLGVLVGVLIAGPHFNDWAIEKILAAIAVSSAVIGSVGHFVIWIVYVAMSEGPGSDDDSEVQDGSSTNGTYQIED
ncbi:hypothetical protein G4G28_12260 [Massilia sp. Dwa41.01b]|uniref:hypothetical protein n=1 Tax=unclassified Massilia TaxID=2609279 RepID=UPI001601C879|nr:MULTISPECIES: hypothetical protein [unclassified Massilia]QNA89059.1 hypothetical protein G4G28_12260 [Massilia sp. Dwa41.01b]QNA99947.1 hypothetical protein G4G31_15875 [Massilia sp. Se16.2.3]